jgi:hypothetical protein
MTIPRRMSGIGLFALGLLISLTLIVVALSPDLEADFYGFNVLSRVRLTGLRCPILMARDEQPLITARVTNESPYKTNIFMRAVISAPGLSTQEDRKLVAFEPGQTKTITWPLSAEDAVYQNLILAKVYMGGAYPMPPAESTCGIYLLNLSGVRGSVVYWTLFGIGLAALLAGVFLLEAPTAAKSPAGRAGDAPHRRGLAGARRGLAIVAAIGLYASYGGLWILALLCLAVIVLILFGMLLSIASG